MAWSLWFWLLSPCSAAHGILQKRFCTIYCILCGWIYGHNDALCITTSVLQGIVLFKYNRPLKTSFSNVCMCNYMYWLYIVHLFFRKACCNQSTWVFVFRNISIYTTVLLWWLPWKHASSHFVVGIFWCLNECILQPVVKYKQLPITFRHFHYVAKIIGKIIPNSQVSTIPITTDTDSHCWLVILRTNFYDLCDVMISYQISWANGDMRITIQKIFSQFCGGKQCNVHTWIQCTVLVTKHMCWLCTWSRYMRICICT